MEQEHTTPTAQSEVRDEKKNKKKGWKTARGKFYWVTGLIFLFLVLLLVLGYRSVMADMELVALNAANAPRYQYEYGFNDEIIGTPSSLFVDLKVEGSDNPLRIEAPASYELSWTIADELKNSDCVVYGMNASGEFFEAPIDDDGGIYINEATFAGNREEGDIDIYSVGCMTVDSEGRPIEEVDEVRVEIVSGTEDVVTEEGGDEAALEE
jgi:hypothetical protein